MTWHTEANDLGTLTSMPEKNNISAVRSYCSDLYFAFANRIKRFSGSRAYWEQRYQSGGDSGAGSYHHLAAFKADFINDLVEAEAINTVIEYGCGDGNQLKLANYQAYVGFDVSSSAVARCREIFADDTSKTFKLIDEYENEQAELVLSLDVIYHLVEDDVYADYMARLFGSATRYVIIYSSNTNQQKRFQAPHVKHRQFTQWVEQHQAQWELFNHVPNVYPDNGSAKKGSSADFFVYKRL